MKKLILVLAVLAGVAHAAGENTFATLPTAGGTVVLGDLRGACDEGYKRAWFTEAESSKFWMGCWAYSGDNVVVLYDQDKSQPKVYPLSGAKLSPKYSSQRYPI